MSKTIGKVCPRGHLPLQCGRRGGQATRIGIYGGTFDPVHLGHLAVVEAVREAARLDCVLFVPTRRQPLKAQGPFAPPAVRLRMLEEALRGNPVFSVSEIELGHAGPSYSIETLDALRDAHPGAELRFILGSDAALSLAAWRGPDPILAGYRPLVMARAGWPDIDWTALERVTPEARALVELVRVPRLEISSSDLRERVRAGRSIRYLVPEGVRFIIEAEGLYRGGEPGDGRR